MSTIFGWTGKILRVDLTERKYSTEPSEEYTQRFIGGIGLGLKVLWNELKFDVGAFDPGNILVFAPGPLTGTLAPGSGRFEVVSKSPRSYPKETITRSGIGGFFGPELKFAGYDALIIQGKSENWVNLWIHDDSVEFREAKDYLGEDTYKTQIRLKKELDSQAKILCIGPAGENLSRLAVILSETSFASGRSGFGAVMGSKNLKAIAVRGTNPINIFDSHRLIEVSRIVKRLTATNPQREWTTRGFTVEQKRELINKFRKRNVGCFSCPMPCFAHIDVPDVGQAAAHCISYFYYPHAKKYYGQSHEVDKAVADGYLLANKYGLDTYEFQHMVNYLKDLYEAGYLRGNSEIPFEEIGSRDFIQTLLRSIAMREGIGDLLAEGCARVADQFGDGWNYCSRYFPAYGSAAHETVRDHPGIALLWALDSRDPIIDQHSYRRLSISYQDDPQPYKLSAEHAKATALKVYGSEKAIDHSTFEYKPETIIITQNRSAVINLLVVCDWIYPVVINQTRRDPIEGDTSLESKLLAAATGNNTTEADLDLIGDRVWNLARAIMVKEGRTRHQDTLHEFYFKKSPEGPEIPLSEFENAKTRYYRLRGWDERNGWPTREKLQELGLYDVADELIRDKLIEW